MITNVLRVVNETRVHGEWFEAVKIKICICRALHTQVEHTSYCSMFETTLFQHILQ